MEERGAEDDSQMPGSGSQVGGGGVIKSARGGAGLDLGRVDLGINGVGGGGVERTLKNSKCANSGDSRLRSRHPLQKDRAEEAAGWVAENGWCEKHSGS